MVDSNVLAIDFGWSFEFPDTTMRMLIHDPETGRALSQWEASIPADDQWESGPTVAWIEDINPWHAEIAGGGKTKPKLHLLSAGQLIRRSPATACIILIGVLSEQRKFKCIDKDKLNDRGELRSGSTESL